MIPLELIKVICKHPEYEAFIDWVEVKAENAKDTGFRALDEKTRWENVGKHDALKNLLKDIKLMGKKKPE